MSSRNESDNPGHLDRASSDTGHDVNRTSSRESGGPNGEAEIAWQVYRLVRARVSVPTS